MGGKTGSKANPKSGPTPRFLANVTGRETRQAALKLLACLVGGAILWIFLEDIPPLRDAEWPKGWPTLLRPLDMVALVSAVLGLGVLGGAMIWATRRRGSWLLLPGVALFWAPGSRPKAFRPSDLELARTSPDAFWVVRRGKPTWLRPMIVPFKGEADQELFERWLSERPFDYTDMLGDFSLVESGEDEVGSGPGPDLGGFVLTDLGPEGASPSEAEGVGSPVPVPAVSGAQAEGSPAPEGGSAVPDEESPAPDRESPAPLAAEEFQRATWPEWFVGVGTCLGIGVALAVGAEYRYGGGGAIVRASGAAAFASTVELLAGVAALLLFLGLQGLVLPTRILRVGEDLLVLSGRAFLLGPSTRCVLGGGRIRVAGLAWEVGYAACTQRKAVARIDASGPLEAWLRERGCALARGGGPWGRRFLALGATAVLGVLTFLLAQDLPFLLIRPIQDPFHQQAFLVTRVSDGEVQGLIVTRPPIPNPGREAQFYFTPRSRPPSWGELLSGKVPPLKLKSDWPTERDEPPIALELEEGEVILVRGLGQVAKGLLRPGADLRSVVKAGRPDIPSLLEGQLLPESPAELHDYASGEGSVRVLRAGDGALYVTSVIALGKVRWLDIQPVPLKGPGPRPLGLVPSYPPATGWPRWILEKPFKPQARRKGPQRGYYSDELPTAAALLKAIGRITAEEASVRTALEPLLPDLWPLPPRPRGSGGSRR